MVAMQRGGKRQRRRRIKLQIVGARICAGGRWHHFCLSRGHAFRRPREAQVGMVPGAIPHRGASQANRRATHGLHLPSPPCAAMGRFLLQRHLSCRFLRAIVSEYTVVTIMSPSAHSSPSTPRATASAAGSIFAPSPKEAALRRRCHDASGPSCSLYKSTARIMCL